MGRSIPSVFLSRKAPSTRRCIETVQERKRLTDPGFVGKHQAPEGALRPDVDPDMGDIVFRVGKHQAPEGALRPKNRRRSYSEAFKSESTEHQKVH